MPDGTLRVWETAEEGEDREQDAAFNKQKKQTWSPASLVAAVGHVLHFHNGQVRAVVVLISLLILSPR